MKFIGTLLVLAVVGFLFYKMETDVQSPLTTVQIPVVQTATVVPTKPAPEAPLVTPPAPTPTSQPDSMGSIAPPDDHVHHLTTDDSTKWIPSNSHTDRP